MKNLVTYKNQSSRNLSCVGFLKYWCSFKCFMLTGQMNLLLMLDLHMFLTLCKNTALSHFLPKAD